MHLVVSVSFQQHVAEVCGCIVCTAARKPRAEYTAHVSLPASLPSRDLNARIEGTRCVVADMPTLPRACRGEQVSFATGASAGGLVAGLFAAGLSPADMGETVVKFRRSDFWDPVGFGGLLRGKKFEVCVVIKEERGREPS